MKSLIITLLLFSLGSSLCWAQQNNKYVYICGSGDSVLLSVDSLTNPGCNYSWYHEGALLAANTSQAHLFVTDTGTYTVTANSPTGCSSDLSNSLIVRLKMIFAHDDSVNTDYGKTVNIDILANDEQACAALDPNSVVIVNQPGNGTLSMDNGVAIYKPSMLYTGIDSFNYSVSDINGNSSNIAKVIISINNVPHSDSENVSIYPNPASEYLYVKGDYTQISTIMLLDDQGRILYETIPTKDITAIRVSHYAQAYYLVRVVYKSKKQTGYKVLIGKK